jgi:hypothetical protein
MPDETYFIRFKEPGFVSIRTIAATVETYGEHLAFLRADGRFADLILAEIFEEWFEQQHKPSAYLRQETCLRYQNCKDRRSLV